MRLRSIPPEVERLLLDAKAPPRLQAHLALVHDVACQLTGRLGVTWPDLVIDQRAVHLGAAIHDIGKAVHPEELSRPGCEHELAGQILLIRHGWPENLSRFAVTHGRSLTASDPMEDLLVALADKVWKGRRDGGLENSLVKHIASVSGQDAWQVWLLLDDILTSLGEAAPERLQWQARHGV